MRLSGQLLLVLLSFILMGVISCEKNTVLQDKTILIDPGHGGTAATDTFRVGPGGEREEWINLRVAKHLRELLTAQGATVIMTRHEDVAVGLKERALMAIDNNADVFISIHHNATADSSVNFPIVYYHANASENQASVQLGEIVINHIKNEMYSKNTPVSLVSDHVIFPTSGAAVLRHSYGIPGIIGEASFFTNPAEEECLTDSTYNKKEARAYFYTLQEFFEQRALPITEKYATIKISPFSVLQEGGRMSDVARLWQQDFYKGEHLFETENRDSLSKALEFFTRSARSFPDSWLAPAAHCYRLRIMKKLGEPQKAETVRQRLTEFYPLYNNER